MDVWLWGWSAPFTTHPHTDERFQTCAFCLEAADPATRASAVRLVRRGDVVRAHILRGVPERLTPTSTRLPRVA